jgi:hypothetical protein
MSGRIGNLVDIASGGDAEAARYFYRQAHLYLLQDVGGRDPLISLCAEIQGAAQLKHGPPRFAQAVQREGF